MKNSKVIITLTCTVIILLAIVGVLVYFLVINGKNSNTTENNNTTNATDNPTSMAETRELTEKELKEFEEYFNDMENNGFLVATYENPKEIDLDEVLYVNSIGKELTKQEENDYMHRMNIEEMYTDCTKYPKSDINNLLKEKLGISLNDVKTDFTYVYMQKYDAYFNMHGDTNYLPVKCTSGIINNYGMCIVNYKMDTTERTVTMKKENDKYIFVSNRNNTQEKVEKEVGDIMLRSNLSSKEIGDYTMYYENNNLCYVVENNSEYGRTLYYKNNKCFAVSITEENENTEILPVESSTGIGDEEYLLFVQSM